MPTVNCNIHNRFDVEVIDAQSGEIKQRAQAENIILDALWAKLLSASPAYNQYIHYGTGSGTPVANRTQLFTFLGSKAPATADDFYSFSDAGIASLRRKISLSENEAVGSTLTEVGIGYSNAATTLCTHAMLKDMNGNPVSIVKTSIDIINIYATVFVHWDTSGYDGGSIEMVRPIKQANMPHLALLMLGTYSSMPSLAAIFTPGGCFSFIALDGQAAQKSYLAGAVLTYSAAAKTIIITINRLAANAGNLGGGFGGIMLGATYRAGDATYGYRTIFYPSVRLKTGGAWFTSSAITGESVGTGDGSTKDFQTDFGRVKAGAKIYVNGVEQTTGVSVDTGKPQHYTDMGQYFDLIDCYPDTPTTPAYPSPVTQQSVPQQSGYPTTGNYAIYYNPHYALGVKSFGASNATVYVSDDKTSWTDITAQAAAVQVAHKNKKYWKIVSTGEGSCISAVTADSITTASNIHFTTPPAAGAVITADYTTETIAKDTNHVFDCTITIQLGELIV